MTLVLLLALLPQAAGDLQLPTGQLIERVKCPSDPSQTYTLYLPSTYTPDRRWPLLFVFDPRGRGTLAAEIFKDAAERYGWIVASSNNTMSDGEWEPNRRAVAAMWPDVRKAYAVDERRIYAAGFSGGASVAWALASGGASLGGIIAVGMPDLESDDLPPRVAWFGAAGRADFNFLSAKRTDERFARAGRPHRLEHFDGAHQWLPRDLAMRAAGWLEVLAMREGSRPIDAALADAVAGDDLAHARTLEESSRLIEATRLYEAIVAANPSTRSAAEAAERLASLRNSEILATAVRDEERVDRWERQTLERNAVTLQSLYAQDLPAATSLIRQLGVNDLLTARAASGYRAESARRSLEILFVQTSFYIWRDFERRTDWRRAATSLEVAIAIHPERPRLWFDLAAAEAMQGRRKQAISALHKAVDLGFSNRSALIQDRRFAGIRSSNEFQAVVARLPSGAVDPPALLHDSLYGSRLPDIG